MCISKIQRKYLLCAKSSANQRKNNSVQILRCIFDYMQKEKEKEKEKEREREGKGKNKINIILI